MLVGKPEEIESFGRLRRTWEENIKMYLKRDDTLWTDLI
jgi:hypothetical protein